MGVVDAENDTIYIVCSARDFTVLMKVYSLPQVKFFKINRSAVLRILLILPV